MKVVVDNIGCILIPKKIRDHLGIKPGTELSIQEAQNGVVRLELVDINSLLVNKGGVLVYQGHKTVGLENQLADLRKDRQVKIESQPN